MKKDRLIALTDAVLAIIMTILILELEKPTTPSLQAFWDLRQNFFACFLSFF
ncbi:TMEM175 family protein, partial [Streptococcus cristatus]